MKTPDDLIEQEIKKILAILEKQCAVFCVDIPRKTKDNVPKERDVQHVHR